MTGLVNIQRGVIATDTDLLIEGGLTEDEWIAAFGKCLRVGEALPWYIGKLMNCMPTEECSQVFNEHSQSTLRVYAWVYRSVPPGARWADLTFKHHQLVASFDGEEQVNLLAGMADNSLSTDQAEAFVRSYKLELEGKPQTELAKPRQPIDKQAALALAEAKEGKVWERADTSALKTYLSL